MQNNNAQHYRRKSVNLPLYCHELPPKPLLHAMQTLIDFFDAQNFMPHGVCLGWDSPLLWLTAISDAVMTLSYATYPIGIAYFVWKRKDLQYRWLYLGFFIAFILTCASTHFLSVVTIWIPLYWLEAYANAISALIATATVFAIWWVIPRALALPSPSKLQKARDAAEAANKAKSVFLANMSHELRTPLNAILGFSELMSLDTEVTEKQKETLAIINRSGAHLLSMINDVLDISKIEAGRFELENRPCHLTRLFQDIGEMINVRAVDKKLNFWLEISSDTPQFVLIDDGKLRQVLINLLGNVIKFTKEGEVFLRVNSHPISDTQTMLSIEVIDSGIGIPIDKIGQLFKPFVQLVQEDSNIKGTGLGLAISKSLVELMGGHISVNSVLGEGSTFKVEIPITLASEDKIEEKQECHQVKHLAPQQPHWRLLVADDNADNRLLLTAMLIEAGFQVREAKNGQEAVTLFEAWQPHLIWMDMRMPIMNGYEATAQIRKMQAGKEVKIIALTASAFKEQHAQIINSGCDAVLHKPIHVSDIFNTLEQHLDVEFICLEEQPITQTHEINLPFEISLHLSPEMRKQLNDAACKLDLEELEQMIEQIRIDFPELASALNQLVQNYQFNQLVQLTND